MKEKIITFIIILITCTELYSEEAKYSESDIILSCKTLTRLAGEAAQNSKKGDLVALHQSYKILREKVSDQSKIADQDAFFSTLSNLNQGKIGKFVFSFADPPKAIGGGWTHREVNEFLEFKENGFKIPKRESLDGIIMKQKGFLN